MGTKKYTYRGWIGVGLGCTGVGMGMGIVLSRGKMLLRRLLGKRCEGDSIFYG